MQSHTRRLTKLLQKDQSVEKLSYNSI